MWPLVRIFPKRGGKNNNYRDSSASQHGGDRRNNVTGAGRNVELVGFVFVVFFKIVGQKRLTNDLEENQQEGPGIDAQPGCDSCVNRGGRREGGKRGIQPLRMRSCIHI